MTSVLYRMPHKDYSVAQRSQGMRIFDENGRSWLDMSGGAAVSMVGHQHPTVIKHIKDQLEELCFAHTASFTNKPQEQLAVKIANRFTEAAAQVYFTSGGSEANETALKLAWQYWAAKGLPDKKKIISREYSYHGNTLGALSVSGNPSRRKESAAPLHDWPRVSPCYAYRMKADEMNEEAYTNMLIKELTQTIEAAGSETVAAFICEPVVGASLGVVGATKNYLRGVRRLCDEHNILLILDEVMCGSGRTGAYFAHAQDGILPDIVTLAKGIAGGYVPLAATVIRQKIIKEMEGFPFQHGHTYVGHPLACAAGLGVQKVLDDEKLLEHSQQLSPVLKDILMEAIGDCPNVGDIRGSGYFYGIEFVANKDSKEGFKNGGKLGGLLKSTSFNNGLICYPGSADFDGKSVPNILLAPPLIATADDFKELGQKLRKTIDVVFN